MGRRSSSRASGCGACNINLFKINTFVRTKFEEAARRHGSEKRTAVLFPPAPSSSASKSKASSVSNRALSALKPNQPSAFTTTWSAAPLDQDQSIANRWSFKSFTNVLVSSSEGSEIAHYYAENQHLEAGGSLSRSLEEEDPFQMDIQRMRNDFVRHKALYAGIQHHPPHMLDVLKTPVVSSRSDFKSKDQAFVPRFGGQHLPKGNGVRHVRPLFRKNPLIDQNKVRPWEETDSVPDELLVEENSPPRPSYHIYRVNVDGTTCPLPVTIMRGTKKRDQESTLVSSVKESKGGECASAPQIQTPILPGTSTSGPGRQIWQSKDGRLPSANSLSRNTHEIRTEISHSSTKANKNKISKGAQKESLVFVNETASKKGKPGVSDDISENQNNDGDVEIVKICKKSDMSEANFILLSSDSSPELQATDKSPNLNSVSSRERVTNSQAVSSENLDGKLSRSLDDDDELPDLSKCNAPKSNCTKPNVNENLKDQPSTSIINEPTLKDSEGKKSCREDDEESLPGTVIFLPDLPETSVLPPNDFQAAAEKDKCDRKEYGENFQNCDDISCVQIDTNNKVTFQLLCTSLDELNNTADNDLQETELIRSSQICHLKNEIVRNNDKREIKFVKESSINVHSILGIRFSGYKDRYKLVQSELIDLFPVAGPMNKTKILCSEIIDLFPVPIPDEEQSIAINGTSVNIDITRPESRKFLEAHVCPSFKESSVNNVSDTNLAGGGTGTITDDSVIEDALRKGLRISMKNKEDYCEFTGLSSLVFVSDGKTVFCIQRKKLKNLECEIEFIRRLASLDLSADIDKTIESLKSNYESLKSTNCGISGSSINKALNIKEALNTDSSLDTSEQNQDLSNTVSVADIVPGQVIVSTSSVNFLDKDVKNHHCNDDSKCRESKDETLLKKPTATSMKDSDVCVEECSLETLSKSSSGQKDGHEENNFYPVHNICSGKTANEMDGKICTSGNEKGNIALLDKDSQNGIHPEIEETIEEMLSRERQSFVINELLEEFILMGEMRIDRRRRQPMHKYLLKQRNCHSKKAELQIGFPTRDLHKHERNIVQLDKEFLSPNMFVKASHCICTEQHCSCSNEMAEVSSHNGVTQASSHTNKVIRESCKASRANSMPNEVTRSTFDPNKVIGPVSEASEINSATSDKEQSPNVFEKTSQCTSTKRYCSCSDGAVVTNHVCVSEANLGPNVETRVVSKVSGDDFGCNEVSRTVFDGYKGSRSVSVNSEMYTAAFDKELTPNVVVETSRCTCTERNCSCSNSVSEISNDIDVTKANLGPNEDVRLGCKVSGADSEPYEVTMIAFDKDNVTGPVSETNGMDKAPLYKESSPNVFVKPNQCICEEGNCPCSNGKLEVSNHTGVTEVNSDLNKETKVVLESDYGPSKGTIAVFDQNKGTVPVSEPIEVTTAVSGPNKVGTPASNQNKSTGAGFEPNEKIGVASGIYSATESSSEQNEVAVTNGSNKEVIRSHSETKYAIEANKSSKDTDIDLRIDGVTEVESVSNETSKANPRLESMTEVRSKLEEMSESDTERERKDITSDNRLQEEDYSITDTFAKPVCYSRMVNVMEKAQVVGMLEIHNLEYTSENRSSHEASDDIKEKSLKSMEITGHVIDSKDEPMKEVEDNNGGKRIEDDIGNEIEDNRGMHPNKEIEVTEEDSRNLKIMTNFQSHSGTNPPKTSQSYSLGELMNRISAKIDQLKRRDTSFHPKKKNVEDRNKRMREFDSTMKQFMAKSKKVKSSFVPRDMSEIHSKNKDTGPVNLTVTHAIGQQIPNFRAQYPKNEYVEENKIENGGTYQIFKSNGEELLVHNMQPCGSIQTATTSHKYVDENEMETKDSCESNLLFTVEPEKQQLRAMQLCDSNQIITPVSVVKQFVDYAKIQLINDGTYDSSGYCCKNEDSVINEPLLQITDNKETKDSLPIPVPQAVYSKDESQTLVEQQLLETHEVMHIPKQLTEDGTQLPCSEISCATEQQTSDILERPSSEEPAGDVHPCVSSVVTSNSPVFSLDIKHEPDGFNSALVEGNQFQCVRENDQVSELQSLRNLAKLYNDSVQSLENIHMASSHKDNDIPHEINKAAMTDCVNSEIPVQIATEEHHNPSPKVTGPTVCLPVSQGFLSKSDSQLSPTKLKSDSQLSSDKARSKSNNSCTADDEVHDQESNTQVHDSNGKGADKRKSNAEESDAKSSGDDDDNALNSTYQRSRKKQRTSMLRIAVPLNDFYQQCLKKLEDAGETLLEHLKMESLGLPKFDRGFLSIKAGITRFLLNQLVRTRNMSADHKCAYQNLLMVHGLVKAADLLMHCGLDSAKQCLQEFCIAHQTLIPNCYDQLLSELEILISEENLLIHPKVQILKKELKVARKMGNSSDSDFKVLVVCKRESESVCRQLQKSLGTSKVGLLPAAPEYQQVLQLIDQHYILVWSEGNGVERIPCSQFTVAVEWEASESHNTRSCVDCCLRQNVHVITLYTVLEGSYSCTENSRLEFNVAQSKGQSSEGKPELGEGAEETAIKEKSTTYTFVASEVVTDNAELHYLLSSVHNINLVERRLRDLVDGEHSERGWADIVVDERTCILLRPLIYLRHDLYRNDITQQLILLSLQFTKCYLILYQHPPYGTRYVFGNRVVKSLNRLVATCGLLKKPDYQVSLLYAYDLQQVGQIVRTIAESSLRSSVSWDEDQWISRPWLTPGMSSHERLLLSLPCINPISAQIILTVMPLRNVLMLPLPALIQSLPWISNKVLTTMHQLIHRKHISVFREEMNESLDVIENIIKTPSHTHPANHVAHVHPVTNLYANLNSHSEGSFSEGKSNDFCLNPGNVDDGNFAFPTFQDKSLNFAYNDNRDILEEIKQENLNSSTTFKESFNQDVSALLNPKEFLSRIADDSSPKLDGTCFLDKEQESKEEPNMNECYQEQTQMQHPERSLPLDIGEQPPCTAKLQYQNSDHEGQSSRKQLFENICQNPGATSQLQSHTSQVMMSPESFVLDNRPRNSRGQFHSELYSPTHYQDHPSFSQFPVTSPYFGDELKITNNNNIGYPGTQVFTGDQASSHPFWYSTSSSIYSQEAKKSIIEPLSMNDQKDYHDMALNSKILNRSLISNEDQVCKEKSMEAPYQNVPDTWQSVHCQDVHSSAQPSLAPQQIFYMTGMTLPHQRESITSPPLPPPSPLVTLRQDGRGNDYPDHYEFPTSQVKIPRSTSNKRLSYTKVPGGGGQTKLVFHPRKTVREKDCSESRDITPSQIRLPTPSPLSFQSVRLGYTKPQGRGGQTKLSFKGL